MKWDSVKEIKQKSKEFIGGESLTPLKEFVAQLPDVLPDNATARISMELVINK